MKTLRDVRIGQTYILRFFAEHSPMELITSL